LLWLPTCHCLLLQNNLQELHALLSFAVGDVLGTASQFKRIYGAPGMSS
jgi:SNF2 family DNA or RNA helicase